MKKICSLCLALLTVLATLSGLSLVCPVAVTAADGVTAASYGYVPGLVAWYDGTQPTRDGHAATNVWEDLIHGYDLPMTVNGANHFTDEGFLLDSQKNYFPEEILKVVNGSAFTVEIRFGDFVSLGQDFNTFMNSDNDNFALFRRNSNNVIEFKYYGNAAAERPAVSDGLNKLQNALVTISYQVGGQCIIYLNGEQAAARDCMREMGADSLFIGHVGNKAFRTTYESIRFYDRALTAEEVAHNAVVDGYGDVKDLYVSDGLVSLYSAISNTATGYDPTATVWADLVSGYNVPVVINDKNYFTREGLHLNTAKNHFPKELVNLMNGDEFTVEMFLGDLISLGTEFETFINSTNDSFSLFRRKSGDVLEVKFATNGANDRPKAQNGLETYDNSLVSVTFKVGGSLTVYVDGVQVAQVPAPNRNTCDDLFFGHDNTTRNYDTTFRALRFYNRELTAAEVRKNAKADGAYDARLPEVDNPGYVSVAQPKTNIVGDVALVRPVNTLAELNDVASAKIKPAAVILKVNQKLEILNNSGKKFATLEEALKTLDYVVMPVFEISDTATADALAEFLKSIRFTDAFFMSRDPALVKYAREALPTVRGVIDYTEAYKDSTGLTDEDCVAIRKSMKSNNGTIALLPQAAARKDAVQHLYDSIVNVWVRTQDQPTTVQRFDALLSGAVGVVSDDTAGLYEAASTLAQTAMTRVPLNIGHRGLPAGNPENTVEGSLAAYAAGADVIEIDIYLTTDNEIVIMHDGSTGRTCNRDLPMEGSTLAQLKELYVNRGFENDPARNNWRIPTFREYLEAFKGKDCRLFIEIKSGKEQIVPLMKELIEEYDMYDQCAVITFVESQMANMRKYYPEMSVGALCGGYMGESNPDMDMRTVMNFIGKYNATLNPSYGGYGANALRAALIRGISIYPWTFADSGYNSYFGWGYSGLTGNTAGSLARLPKRLCVEGARDEMTVSVGDVLQADASVLAYKRVTTNVNGKIEVIEGQDLVTVDGETLTFTAPGDVSFIVSYTNTRIVGYTLYTQPITIHVEAPDVPEMTDVTPEETTTVAPDETSEEISSETVAETTAPVETPTETAEVTTEPSAETTTAGTTETADAADTTGAEATTEASGGCSSVLGGASLLLWLAAGAAMLKKRERE